VTRSDARRTENVNEALRIMMAKLADCALSDCPFTVSDSEFENVLTTTWDECRRLGWIKSSGPYFFLTGAGWIAGLKLTGLLNDAFREKAFKLVGLLKRQVAGRQDDAMACVHDFENEGITGGWVFNIVESAILEKEIDPDKSYELRWSTDDPWNSGAPFFGIPRTLGQRRLK
jgi:hypothetical protein